MPSHAEKNQTEIENYYHIIDPEGRLSKYEKAEEERKVLANMPACFPEALRYVMTRFGFTQEALAFESKVSESTIGRYRNGKVESFSEKNVVALCVAMHLPPWLSFALIAKAGFSLAATKEQLAHLMILNCMYMRSIDEVNEYLRERGNACNGVQREHNKKLNNGLPILHKVPPKRDYGRYFCIMAEKGGTSHGGLTEKLSPFFHAKKQEVNAYGR